MVSFIVESDRQVGNSHSNFRLDAHGVVLTTSCVSTECAVASGSFMAFNYGLSPMKSSMGALCGADTFIWDDYITAMSAQRPAHHQVIIWPVSSWPVRQYQNISSAKTPPASVNSMTSDGAHNQSKMRTIIKLTAPTLLHADCLGDLPCAATCCVQVLDDMQCGSSNDVLLPVTLESSDSLPSTQPQVRGTPISSQAHAKAQLSSLHRLTIGSPDMSPPGSPSSPDPSGSIPAINGNELDRCTHGMPSCAFFAT